MEARRSPMTDVEAKVSVEVTTTTKTVETDLGYGYALSGTKRLKDETTMETNGEMCSDVEDPVAKVFLEGQVKQITISNALEKDLAHGSEDGNLKPLDDDDEGKDLRLLFEDEEDKKFKAFAKLFFYQSTEEAEGIGGGGDAFGASCWFD